jgi:DMSO/TMAO reductase YedYZ heme-binding membrane subunit
VTVLDLSAYIGLGAVFFATLNICIGLMIWGRYSPVRYWPHRRFDIFRLHRWTGYLTLGLTLLHPLPLLFSSQPPFRVLDIVLPLWSPQQPLENTLGAAALYLLLIIIVTSVYRIELGRRLWKRLHYLTYAAAAFLFVHGILTDPTLKPTPVDPLDGEKVYIEACLALILAGTAWRIWYTRKKRSRELMRIQLAFEARVKSRS